MAALGAPWLAPEPGRIVVHCQRKVALGALAAGRGWVSQRVAGLAEQKALVLAALAPLGDGAVQGGSGALCHAAAATFSRADSHELSMNVARRNLPRGAAAAARG